MKLKTIKLIIRILLIPITLSTALLLQIFWLIAGLLYVIAGLFDWLIDQYVEAPEWVVYPIYSWYQFTFKGESI